MATPADIAAWIGAAAWLPQIGAALFKRFVKPRVRIIPEARVSVGYTNFGAIFNLRVAISSDRVDAILDRITVDIQHEDGDRHQFAWISLRETFSQITDEQGNRQTVERDQPAIALKVSTALLAEKFVLFQEPQFHQSQRPLIDRVVEIHNHLRSTSPQYREDTIRSKEMSELIQFFRSRFWWRPGRYSVRFGIQSANGARLLPAEYEFTLLQADVDALRSNVDGLERDWKNRVMVGTEGYVADSVLWTWREPALINVTVGSRSRMSLTVQAKR